MKTISFLNELALGELSNLEFGDKDSIAVGAVPKVLTAVNDGLIRLHSKFALSTKDLEVIMDSNLKRYELSSKYCKSKEGISTESLLYIKDSLDNPFNDDLLKIYSISVDGTVYQDLTTYVPGSGIAVPKYNVINVSSPTTGTSMFVSYQAKPVALLEEDVATSEIDLPWFLYEALKSYVAYKVYGAMNTQEMGTKSKEYYGKFEGQCNEAYSLGHVEVWNQTTNSRFLENGWI